jgi:hypothetical protein
MMLSAVIVLLIEPGSSGATDTQASNSPSGPTRPFPNSPYRLLLAAFQALLTSIDPLTALRQE